MDDFNFISSVSFLTSKYEIFKSKNLGIKESSIIEHYIYHILTNIENLKIIIITVKKILTKFPDVVNLIIFINNKILKSMSISISTQIITLIIFSLK